MKTPTGTTRNTIKDFEPKWDIQYDNMKISIDWGGGRVLQTFKTFQKSNTGATCYIDVDAKTPPGTTTDTIAAIAKITAAASGLILVVSFIIFAIWNH